MHADPRNNLGGIRARVLYSESVATTTASPLGLVRKHLQESNQQRVTKV
jgi:hypothetical protein